MYFFGEAHLLLINLNLKRCMFNIILTIIMSNMRLKEINSDALRNEAKMEPRLPKVVNFII
jgi:hypothetical protein